MRTKCKGSVELISGSTPTNNQDFPLVDAHYVQIDDEGQQLDEKLDRLEDSVAGFTRYATFEVRPPYLFYAK